ncbi:hypothetical protein MRB53_013825 [Persea americana]|uniref:Uncharacterized protein n=1 Tax=Persea americana TaxID=3435 RepID=A0ACC2K9K9_PERAE|nr:hypothetical protein MRB53_013825 [Persea americana]
MGVLPTKTFFFSEKTHSLCLFQISQRTRPNQSWRPYFGGLGRSGTPLYPLTRSVERRGFAFVRFGSLKEAYNAVELAHGRSWRGRKIQVQMARFKQDVKASCAVLTKHPAGSPPSMPVRPAWKALPKISSNDFSRSYRGRGGRLHVWRIETFSLLGECLGSVLEVGPATARKENLLFGRVKVAGNLLQDLPQRLHLWLDDLCMPIDVELEREEKKGVLNVGDYEDSRTFMDSRVIRAKHTAANSCNSSTITGLEEEDDGIIEGCSNSNSNLKHTPRQQILNSKILDLDLFPRSRASLVEFSSDSVRGCRSTPSRVVSSQSPNGRVVPIGKTAQDLTTAKRLVVSSGKTTAREKHRSPDGREQDDCRPALWEGFLGQGSPQWLLATVDTATVTGSPSPTDRLKHYSPAAGSSSPVDCFAAVKRKLAMSSPSSTAVIPYPAVIFPLPADPSLVAAPSLLLSPPPVDALLSPLAPFPAASTNCDQLKFPNCLEDMTTSLLEGSPLDTPKKGLVISSYLDPKIQFYKLSVYS